MPRLRLGGLDTPNLNSLIRAIRGLHSEALSPTSMFGYHLSAVPTTAAQTGRLVAID